MRRHLIIATLGMLLLASCSETKYVAEGELLLDKVKVKSDTRDRAINTTELKSYVRQRGNSRWFSLIKVPLYTYSLSGRDTTRWLNRTLRSIGEPPQLYDSVQTVQSMVRLRDHLQNMGYLRATVDVAQKVKGKKLRSTYLLHPGKRYKIRHVSYDIQDSAIASLLNMADTTQWGLHSGMNFDADNLDSERKRIVSELTQNGYYRFNKDFISYRADSIEGTQWIDLTLVLHRFRNNQVKDAPHQRYTMGDITYRSGDMQDSTIHLRPKVLRNNTFLESGAYYSSRQLQSTYNHFGRLGAVRYTNISFTEHPSEPVLDCDIAISTNKPSTISFQPEGTNTAGDFGAAASLTYQNRNLFRGSEVLSLELRGAYEAIRGLEGYSNQDFTEYSLESRLQFPRLIAPWLSRELRQRLHAVSEVSLLYDLQDRPEFHRRVLSAVWRYRWNLPDRHERYQLDLLDLNYVFMPWISPTFRREYLDNETSRNAILRYNYEDLFITKLGFGFSFTKGMLALKAGFETSGNVLYAGSKLLGASRDQQGHYRLFNIAFAQYAKGDFDITRTFPIDQNNRVVLHMGLGIAFPYGNSSVLPFEKRYFSGGANSVRGWSVRSLGPGKYKERDGRINFINQTGDMKLDLNAEYRTHLFWKLDGAAFIDAGNIWTLRDYDIQPGGQFSLRDFPSQLAVGYGLGMRFNLGYFILRFDLGMKAVNPAFEDDDDEHYPILHPRFSRDYAFHFAVGLPF